MDMNNLALLSFRGALANTTRWPERKTFFAAETCARHLYLMTAQDLVAVPTEIARHDGTKVFTGPVAYTQFIRVTSGLASLRPDDYNISSQVKNAWLEYSKSQPERARKFGKVMENAIHDARLLKDAILNRLYPRNSFERTAAELSRLRPGGYAMIIADKTGRASNLAQVLGRDSRHAAGHIVVTSPDAEKSRACYNGILSLKEGRYIKASVEEISFDMALTDGLNLADVIFNSMAVSIDPSPEEIAIHHAWLPYRDCADKTLVNVYRCTETDGKVTKLWQDLENDPNFVPYEQVKDHFIGRVHFNERLLKAGLEAAEQITAIRLDDARPQKVIVNDNDEALSLQVIAGKKQRGARPVAASCSIA